MKLVKHSEAVVAIIEQQCEKVYLKSQQRPMRRVPRFLVGNTTAFAAIDPMSLQVPVCAGQDLLD